MKGYTKEELIWIARENNITGFSNKSKVELLQLIEPIFAKEMLKINKIKTYQTSIAILNILSDEYPYYFSVYYVIPEKDICEFNNLINTQKKIKILMDRSDMEA